MCKDTPEEQTYFKQLQSSITSSLNNAFADYNMVRPYIERLQQQNADDRGALIEGATSMIRNRVNGVLSVYRSPEAFLNAGFSGWKWACYFARNPKLNDDVYNAGMFALYNKLWPPSLTGAVTVVTTGMDLSTGGAKEYKEQVLKRYEQERNALAVSVVLGMGVAQLLKYTGNVVQTDMARMLFRKALPAWNAAGALGLCYGLGRLHETMHETGDFGARLVEKRDAFCSANADPEESQFEDALRDHIERWS
jgi:hypothetical protein